MASDTPPQPRQPTHAQLYSDALWDADPDDLTQAEMTMALCYANHARRSDRAWVTDRRLMQQCKIRSTSTVARVRDSLIEKGWLRPLHPDTGLPMSPEEREELRRQRRTALYLLAIPTAASLSEAATSTIAAEDHPPTSTSEAGATSMSEAEESGSASMSEATASMSESHCFDERTQLSSDSLEDSLKRERSLSTQSPAGEEADRSATPKRETSSHSKKTTINSPHQLVKSTGLIGDHEVPEFVAWVERTRKPKHLGWWRTVIANEDLPEHIVQWYASQQPRAWDDYEETVPTYTEYTPSEFNPPRPTSGPMATFDHYDEDDIWK